MTTLETVLKVAGVKVDSTIQNGLLAAVRGSDLPSLLELAESDSVRELLSSFSAHEDRPDFAMCPECNAIFRITNT